MVRAPVEVRRRELDARAGACVAPALLPQVGEDPVVVLERDGLRRQVGEELSGYRRREARGEGFVGLVGQPILVADA